MFFAGDFFESFDVEAAAPPASCFASRAGRNSRTAESAGCSCGFSPSPFFVASWAAVLAVSLVLTRVASTRDRKSTRLNSSHLVISYAVFCLKKKNRPGVWQVDLDSIQNLRRHVSVTRECLRAI